MAEAQITKTQQIRVTVNIVVDGLYCCVTCQYNEVGRKDNYWAYTPDRCILFNTDLGDYNADGQPKRCCQCLEAEIQSQ
jgi:hypothetical protein